MVRQGHLQAVLGTFVIGYAVLLVVGCAGTRSETSKEQGPTEATTKELTRSPQATASEEARCEGTRTFKKPTIRYGVLTTNDLPGRPKGGLLSGTDKPDQLAGEEGADEVRALGGNDFLAGGHGRDAIDVIYGGAGDDKNLDGLDGDDVLYGGDGNDLLYAGDHFYGQGRDKLYCGKGKDEYEAGKHDYVSSSCEVKYHL